MDNSSNEKIRTRIIVSRRVTRIYLKHLSSCSQLFTAYDFNKAFNYFFDIGSGWEAHHAEQQYINIWFYGKFKHWQKRKIIAKVRRILVVGCYLTITFKC